MRFARVVAAVGACVAITARRRDLLESLADDLRAAGTRTLPIVSDVADPEQCRAAVDLVVAEFGRIDGLVNNAGVGTSIPALRETDEAFRRVIDINLLGPFWMARACAPHMPSGSSIVNVSSVLGHVAARYPQASYAASKAGLIGLTRDLAQQWSRRRGIRVNALCPGYFATDMLNEGRDKLREMIEQQSILGRFGVDRELDGALLFLLGEASSYVT